MKYLVMECPAVPQRPRRWEKASASNHVSCMEGNVLHRIAASEAIEFFHARRLSVPVSLSSNQFAT